MWGGEVNTSKKGSSLEEVEGNSGLTITMVEWGMV